MKPPIVVTGAHRAGTTWVGRMLAAGGEVVYINEPFSPIHRPGVCAARFTHWYEYVCADNEASYLTGFRAMLELRYGWWRELKALRSLRDAARMVRDGWAFARGRRRGLRPLLKDPFAVFSVPWLVRRWGAQTVALVRHPAAVVSSWLRLGWVVRPARLWEQPLLVRDWLAPEAAVVQAAGQSDDPLVAAAVLWRLIYGVVYRLREQGLALVIRYEDLALDPEGAFERVYRHLGLTYTPQAQRAIRCYTQAEAVETDPAHPHRVRLNSREAATVWKQRLDPEAIQRIREWTEPVARHFYGDEDW